MLNNIKMHVTQTADNGIVNAETVFEFVQQADLVKASYAGGKIQWGYLVGRLEENTLRFSYCQLRHSGELDHGESSCVLSVDKSSGKLQLEEQFEMSTGNTREIGTNIFTEI